MSVVPIHAEQVTVVDDDDMWRSNLRQYVMDNPGKQMVLNELYCLFGAMMPLASATRLWYGVRPYTDVSHEQLRWSAFMRQMGSYECAYDPPMRRHIGGTTTRTRTSLVTFVTRPCRVCGQPFSGRKQAISHVGCRGEAVNLGRSAKRQANVEEAHEALRVFLEPLPHAARVRVLLDALSRLVLPLAAVEGDDQ